MKPIDLAAFVEELARVSGEAILPFFRTAMHAVDKSHGGAFDPVTEADRAAEVAMRRLIARDFPGHGIVGEEFDDVAPGSEFVWVLESGGACDELTAGWTSELWAFAERRARYLLYPVQR